MRNWNLTNIGVDFRTPPTRSFSVPNPVADGSLTASALDEDDKLIFLIRYGAQSNGDGALFDANGILRATIPAYRSTTVLSGTTALPVTYGFWGREVAVVPVPGASNVRLNDIMNQSLNTPPATNFFAGATQLNKTYKVSLTLEDGCGFLVTRAGFFTPTTVAYRAAPQVNGTGLAPKVHLALYPNPGSTSHGTVQLRYELPTTQAVELRLTSLLTGLPCRAVPAQGWQSAGPHQVEVDLSGLPAGQYVAELVGEPQTRVRFAKAE